MSDYSILDSLPNAVCVINNKDLKVNYVNKLFDNTILPKKIAMGHNFSVEFLLEPTDQVKLAASVSLFETYTSTAPVSLGVMETLCVETVGDLPRQRNVMWAMSCLDEENVILSGTMMPLSLIHEGRRKM
jgi:hypothetical protein